MDGPSVLFYLTFMEANVSVHVQLIKCGCCGGCTLAEQGASCTQMMTHPNTVMNLLSIHFYDRTQGAMYNVSIYIFYLSSNFLKDGN